MNEIDQLQVLYASSIDGQDIPRAYLFKDLPSDYLFDAHIAIGNPATITWYEGLSKRLLGFYLCRLDHHGVLVYHHIGGAD